MWNILPQVCDELVFNSFKYLCSFSIVWDILPTQPFLFQFNIVVCFVFQLRRVLSYNVKYATRRQGIVHLCVVTSVHPLPPPSLLPSSPLESSWISLPTNVCVWAHTCVPSQAYGWCFNLHMSVFSHSVASKIKLRCSSLVVSTRTLWATWSVWNFILKK